MTDAIAFTLSYEGKRTDQHQIDFYDAAQALIGFQRSLALTTHLILNGEIITQAPSLKGATILAIPAEQGSWKWTAIIVCTGQLLYQLGTAPRDTVVGNLISSAYDLVISESLGFHVDFERTLGAQYEEYKRQSPDAKPITQSKMDSLVEKCEPALRQIHRPIVESESAAIATITASFSDQKTLMGEVITSDTYDYLQHTIKSDFELEFTGKVSGYNRNTFKGRVYLTDSYRPVPFVLDTTARSKRDVRMITNSLALSAANADDENAVVKFVAYSFTSRTGRIKWLLIKAIIYN